LNCGKDNFPNMPTEPCDDCQLKESLFEKMLNPDWFGMTGCYVENYIYWTDKITGMYLGVINEHKYGWATDINDEFIEWIDKDDYPVTLNIRRLHDDGSEWIEEYPNIISETQLENLVFEECNTWETTVKLWIKDNEDYLWDIYESWYESATETEIKEMEGC